MGHLFVWIQYVLPHHALSRVVATLAASRLCKAPLIHWFIKRYKVDLSESAISDPRHFASFNDFFTRALKVDARPIAQGPGAVVCPADGCVSQSGLIEDHLIFQAKGKHYSLDALLANSPAMVELFRNGSFATVYLSPKDYHRVHMPLSGTLRQMTYVPGRLFSVNPVTTEHVPDLFARNERLICLFDTPAGAMAVILVGAMIVASIETVWSGLICPSPKYRQLLTVSYADDPAAPQLAAGTEMGRFKLGSTAIVLFAKDAIEWADTIKAGETVRMGQLFGQQLGQTRS